MRVIFFPDELEVVDDDDKLDDVIYYKIYKMKDFDEDELQMYTLYQSDDEWIMAAIVKYQASVVYEKYRLDIELDASNEIWRGDLVSLPGIKGYVVNA